MMIYVGQSVLGDGPRRLSADERAELRSKQLEVLYEQSPVARAATVVAAVILVAVFWSVTPHTVLVTWFLLLVLLTGARSVLTRRYKACPGEPERTGYWLGWFVAGVAASGALWGSTVIVLVPEIAEVHLGFAVLWVCGLSAGAVAALSAVRFAFLAFALPALIPGALYLLLFGQTMQATVGAAMLMFCCFVTLNAFRMHQTIMNGLLLQIDNTRLIADLAAKNQWAKRLTDELEVQVTARTEELSRANRKLQQEIAERKRSEEKLRQSAVVFENTTQGVMITDLQQQILTVNPAFTEITGYEQAEVVGAKVPQLFYAGDREEQSFATAWAAVSETGRWQGEIWNRRKNGELYPEWLNISAVRDREGQVTHYVGVLSDITTIKESQEQLEHQAHHDSLTDLPNRLLFHARLEHALERARREDIRIGVLFLDLDYFKDINDSLGHLAGDHLLQTVAARLLSAVREEDTVARLGGDEFTILLEGLPEPRHAKTVAEKVLKTFAKPFELEGGPVYTTASIGISLYPEDGQDVASLLKHADRALYRAKHEGRNNFRWYSETH